MKEKINVDSLPCKISWTTPLLLICIVATIAAIVARKIGAPHTQMTGEPGAFADVAVCLNLFSALLWVVFFALFASACKRLPNNISTATMFMALTGCAASVLTCISSIYSYPVVGIFGIVFWIACLGGVFWLGNALSNNYAGPLEEIGIGLRKLIKIAIACAIAMILFLVLGSVSIPILYYIGIGLYIFSILSGIWMMWILLDEVIMPIYQMLNWGNQEGVTQNDMQECVKQN